MMVKCVVCFNYFNDGEEEVISKQFFDEIVHTQENGRVVRCGVASRIQLQCDVLVGKLGWKLAGQSAQKPFLSFLTYLMVTMTADWCGCVALLSD